MFFFFFFGGGGGGGGKGGDEVTFSSMDSFFSPWARLGWDRMPPYHCIALHSGENRKRKWKPEMDTLIMI